MTRRIFQLAVGCVLIFATLTPLANVFDTWDRGQPPANDTELRVAAWFAGAGLVMVVASLLRYGPAPDRVPWGSHGTTQPAPVLRSVPGELPHPTASPPLVPLRI